MKELIGELIANLVNPKTVAQKKLDVKYDLQVKFNKSLFLKEYLKTKAWHEFDRPRIYKSLESGIGNLIRDGLTMNETQIKAVIANMRANLNQVIEMRYAIEVGEEAGMKLDKMKP